MKYKVTKSQFVSKYCVVCGTDNPCGMKAQFYETENKEVIGVFCSAGTFQGFPHILHGGITAAILDEVMARVIMTQYGEYTLGLTVEMKVRYHEKIPLDVELKALGRTAKDTRLIFEGTAEIILPDGKIAATAEGKYIKKTLDQIVDHDFLREHWRAPKIAPPEEIYL